MIWSLLDALFNREKPQALFKTNPLAGLPLDYLIGADRPQPGRRGRITEVAYGQPPPGIGPCIAYCNLFDENNTGRYGPYLHDSDTAQQYNEGQIDPSGAGWQRNLREQFARCRGAGFEYIELDNPDAYQMADVLGAVDLAATYDLKVVAKNPYLMASDPVRYVARCHGIIVEKGAGAAQAHDQLRRRAGKPDMPVWFVFFGSGRAAGQQIANAIAAGGFKNMGVTCSTVGEYGNSIDVLLPTR